MSASRKPRANQGAGSKQQSQDHYCRTKNPKILHFPQTDVLAHPHGDPHRIVSAFQECGQFWQRRCPENIGALNLHSSTKCHGRQPLRHRCQRSGSCRTWRRCCRGFRCRPTAARVPCCLGVWTTLARRIFIRFLASIRDVVFPVVGLASHDAGAWGTDNGRRPGSSTGVFSMTSRRACLSCFLMRFDRTCRYSGPRLSVAAKRSTSCSCSRFAASFWGVRLSTIFSVVFWRWGQHLVALDFTRFLVGGQLGRGRDFLVVVIVVSILGFTS